MTIGPPYAGREQRYGEIVSAPPLPRDAAVDAVVHQMDEQGYAVVERLLPTEHAARIRAELTEVLAAVPLGRNDFEGFGTRRIYNIFAKTRALDELALHPLLEGVLDRVLGLHQFSAPVGIEIGPGEKAQILHYDDAIYPLPWPHPEVVVNSMWAFDDFTEANGATRVVPASHHRPTATYDPDQPTIALEMPAGSVVFYTGTLLHRGGANATDRPRLGVILEFCAGWIRPQENHVIGVPRHVARTLPARLQELLGYNVYPPFIGNVDGRHPRKYLESN
jgi:ectoine hydroxylase-related dioxygenase (phytanoyl-CoA dioxygenase family)